MTRTISRVAAAAGFGLAVASTLLAGGFWLEVGNPKAASDPKAREAVLVVRPIGCGEPTKARISGTAEGLVNGRRQSVPLRMVPLSQPALYAVHRTWPQEGVWMLALTGSYDGHFTSALAPMGPEGLDRKAVKLVGRKPTAAEIDDGLRALAAGSPPVRVTD